MSEPKLRAALVLAFLLSLVLGAAKHWVRHGDLPAWADTPANSYDGFVSIDNYSTRAERVRCYLTGEPLSAWAERSRTEDTRHPTGWLVPAVVGAVSTLGLRIPIAFAVVVALSQAAALWLLVQICGALRHGPRSTGLVAALLFVLHELNLRSSAQLYLDPPMTALTLCSLLCCVRAWDSARWGWLAGSSLALCALVLTKVSFLPALAIPLCVPCLLPHPPSRAGTRWTLASFVPLLVTWVAFTLLAAEGRTGRSDFAHLQSVWRFSPQQLGQFALEMALLFQLLPLLVLRRESRAAWRPGGERLVVALCVLFFSATWAVGLPSVPRLYIAPLSFLCILAAPGALALLERGGRARAGLALLASANVSLAVATL